MCAEKQEDIDTIALAEGEGSPCGARSEPVLHKLSLLMNEPGLERGPLQLLTVAAWGSRLFSQRVSKSVQKIKAAATEVGFS